VTAVVTNPVDIGVRLYGGQTIEQAKKVMLLQDDQQISQLDDNHLAMHRR